MILANFSEAQNYLFAHIPKNPKNIFSGGAGLERTKFMLGLLDNPQDKLRVIHVAGTSGKSSTSYILSSLLSYVNKRTGLFISPHITNIRERIRVNNIFINEIRFVEILNEITPFIERVEKSEFGKPTYFEILTVLAFYFFWKEKVDYAVMETGIGGSLDGTNVVNSLDKVCVITKIGMDHTEILGKTISEIIKQKAGIITSNSLVITPEQRPIVNSVIKKRAKSEKAKLFVLKQGVNYKDIEEGKNKTVFTFDFLGIQLSEVRLGLLGKHQVENCALALTALILLSKRDGWEIDEDKIRKALEKVNFFGRLSRYKIAGKTVILDGAHNSQKMEAFLETVGHIYPGRKFHFLIAFKNTKDFIPLLRQIVPFAASITVTSFKIKAQDWSSESIEPEIITKALEDIGFYNYGIIDDPNEAWESLINMEDKTGIIITGSFYLISTLYPSGTKCSKKSTYEKISSIR